MSRSILFTTWGNPFGWDIVEYSFNGFREESYTTLSILSKAINPDYTVIITLDTLSLYDESIYASRGVNYSDLIKSVEELVRERLNHFGVKDDIDILVLPGKGCFKHGGLGREAVFDGFMTDYKYLLAFYLARYLSDRLSGLDRGEDVKIFLDLSHGINYMPTFAHEVLSSLSRILRFRFGRVSYTVFNSDPVIRGLRGPYQINRVMEVGNLDSEFPGEGLNGKPIKFIDETLGRVLAGRIRGIDWGGLNMFIGGIVNGLPLLILETYKYIGEITGILDSLIDDYIKYTDVEFDGSRMSVRHRIGFGRDLETLSRLMLLSQMIRDRVSEPIDGFYRLESLRSIQGIYPSNNRNMRLISNELYILEKVLREFIDRGGYHDIIPSGTDRITLVRRYSVFISGDEVKDEGGFRRNFMAHAGLERNITVIKMDIYRDRHEIYLRYGWDEDIEIKGKRKRVRKLILEASTENLVKPLA